MLLDAVHIARRDGADVTLDIIGDGPDRAALEARSAQLGLAGAVRFLGPLPRAALYERMATAHAVVVPSRREGLGLVAVEALALGRPVIASHVGGLPEVVTAGTGMLVASRRSRRARARTAITAAALAARRLARGRSARDRDGGRGAPRHVRARDRYFVAGSTSASGLVTRTTRSASSPTANTWNAANKISSVFVATRKSLPTRS